MSQRAKRARKTTRISCCAVFAGYNHPSYWLHPEYWDQFNSTSFWSAAGCRMAQCIDPFVERCVIVRPGVDGPPVFLCTAPVDFWKSINGLSLIVEQSLNLNPFEIALYVFINRKRDKLKILYWKKNGFCLWYKSLQQERFKCPSSRSGVTVTLSSEELNWLIDGFVLWRNQPHQTMSLESVG